MRIKLNNKIYKTGLSRAEVLSVLNEMDDLDLRRAEVERQDANSTKWVRMNLIHTDSGVKFA